MHRRTRIEDTAGPKESLAHSLMTAEAGLESLPFGAPASARKNDKERAGADTAYRRGMKGR